MVKKVRKPAKAAAPSIIRSVGGDDLRKYGSGNVGELNRLAESKEYAADEGVDGSTVGNGTTRAKMAKLSEKEVAWKMAELFPTLDPGEAACDCYVIVQELLVPRKVGSVLLADTSIDANQIVTSFAKVVSIGPMAFKQDVTGEEFPGGASFAVGDIVRVPKIGNQEFSIDDVIFNYWKDRDIKGKITDLRKIVAMYF